MPLQTILVPAGNLIVRIACAAVIVSSGGCGGGSAQKLADDSEAASMAHDASTAQVAKQADDAASVPAVVESVGTDDAAIAEDSARDATAAGARARKVLNEKPVVLGANSNYIKGQWLYYGGMWGRYLDTRLTEVADLARAGGSSNNYYVRASLYPSAFPSGWTQSWSTPSDYSYTRPGHPGVYGYLAASYCNYDRGSLNALGCVQRQVDNITTLISDFNLEISAGSGGTLGDFNVLHEFYLTGAQGNLETKQLEVGVFLHASDGGAAFHARGTQLGTFTDPSGNAWTCARNGTFVTFLHAGGTDVLKGSFDWRSALMFLKSAGQVQGNWWFNGIGLGVEPARNGGTLTAQRWALTYK